MLKKVVIVIGCLVLSGISVMAYANDSTCAANLKATGSFFSGRTFTTWEEFPAVQKDDAYAKLYRALAKDGWSIGQADKDAGVITASQQVSFGKGAVAPLNILIETSGSGVKVTETFSMAGGLSASKKAIQHSLCSNLAAVEAK